VTVNNYNNKDNFMYHNSDMLKLISVDYTKNCWEKRGTKVDVCDDIFDGGAE